MIQKTKQLLGKLMMMLLVVCCVIGFTVGLSACSDGRGITSTAINESGELIVTYTDGTTENLGKVVGTNGAAGQDGKDGQDGAPGKDGEDGQDGAPGKDGEDGQDGAPGKDGEDGKDGVGITSVVVNDEGELVVTYSDGKTVNLGKVVGADGEDGDPGKDGVGIKSITVNDKGMLVIEYTDGNKVEVDIPTVGETCKHEAAEVLVIKEHTSDALGVYLLVCPDCGHSVVEHSERHHYEETVVPPTCTEEGYTGRVCSDCGDAIEKTDIVKALGHDYDEGHYVVEEGRTICEDGGMTVKICKREGCGNIIVEKTEPIGHHCNAWETTTAPTINTKGALKGTCDNCGKYVTHELPMLNDKDYAYTVTKEKEFCTDEGEAVYTYELDGQKFEFTVKLLPEEHTLNGNHISKLLNEDGTIDYDVEGITEFPDEKSTCTENGRGYFKCEECGEMVYVETHKGHTFEQEPVPTTPATCTTDGEAEGFCTECNETITIVLPKLGHSYEWKLTKEADGTFTLTGACAREECGDVQTKKGLTDVKEEIVKPAACDSEGETKYTYTDKVSGETIELIVKTAKTAHTLNGKDASKLANSDGLYNAAIEGIKEFPDYVSTCEKNGKGYYQCEKCGEMVYVDTYREHNYTSYETVKAPTCTEEGLKRGHCSVCDKEVEEKIPALGHSFEWKLTKEENDTFTLTGTCTREDCDYVETKNNLTDVKEEIIKPASCDSEGEVKYTYTDKESGKTVELIVKTAKTAHTLNGKDATKAANEDGTYNVTIEGVKEFPDNKATCTEAGKGYYICEKCGDLVYVDTWKGHTYTDSKVIKPATCTEKGIIEYTCDDCGEKVQEEIEALGHSYNYTVGTEPAFGKAGSVTIGCDNCDFSAKVELPALSEDSYKVTTIVEATCSAEGVDRYSYELKEYGITFSFDVITEMIAHTEGETYTWIDEGIRYTGYVCEKCGQMIVTKTEAIETPEENA